MRILKTLLASAFGIILFAGIGAMETLAQEKPRDEKPQRPIIVRYYYPDPFWSWNRWQYDPYFYDPYLRERRERYYLRDEVRDARSELNEHLEEYGSDGIITAEERRELDDDYSDLNEALSELEEFQNVYDES